jgi:hypothetical protein
MKILMACALVMVVATAACAQSTVPVILTWMAPATGSPVNEYTLQLSSDGGPYDTVATTPTTSVEVQLVAGHTYTARVAGRDYKGRMGDWSSPSLPYEADAGRPGVPGIVVFTQVR